MSIHVKVLDPANTGFVVRDELTLEETEAPDMIDVPVSFETEGPLLRYKFRFKSFQGIYFYSPVHATTVRGGNA